MDRTKTPPPSQERPRPKNTPYSRGSGSHTAYPTNHTVGDYATYLEEDISSYAKFPFNDFLRVVLNHPEHEWEESLYEAITKKGDFSRSLEGYRRYTAVETDRFPWLTNLLKCIVDELEKSTSNDDDEFDTYFARIDPKHVRGSHAERTPDFGFFKRTAFFRGERAGWDDVKNGPPTDSEYHWMELLGYLEVSLAPPLARSSALDEIQITAPFMKPEAANGKFPVRA